MNIIQIDTSILVEDPTNRKVGGVDIIKSVETLGVLQPILVSQEGDQYKVIAGARRVASAKHYGIPVVPAIVIEKGSVQIQAAENFDRKNLNPIDESDMILALKKDGMTREAIADWMNLSVQQVAKRERLGKLSTKMKNLVKSGQLSASVASEFAMISKDAQDEYLDSYTGKDICSISPAQAKEKARWHGGISLNYRSQELFVFIDSKGESCKTCPRCEGSDNHTFFEETEDKVCYDKECFNRRICEYVKRYRVPFLSSDPKLNEISNTTLDEEWEEIHQYQRTSYTEVVEGINEDGMLALYAKGKTTVAKTEDPTRAARKLFNSHVKEMNEILSVIEKITGEALEEVYRESVKRTASITEEIDMLARQVVVRNYWSDVYEYDGVSCHSALDDDAKPKLFAKAILLSKVDSPIRWQKTGPNSWPLPPSRNNELIKLAEWYVGAWESNELRLKYYSLWEQYVLEQWREGNKGMERLLVDAGNINKESWK